MALAGHSKSTLLYQKLKSPPPTKLKTMKSSIYSPSDSKSSTSTLKIATWNVHSATDEFTLAMYAETARRMGIAVLALQETKRTRANLEDWKFAGKSLRNWRYIGTGKKRLPEEGVGFLIYSPSVEVHEIIEPSESCRGRLLAVRLSISGLRLKLVNCYAPHEGYADSSKDAFFARLHQLTNSLDKHSRFKQVLLGDMNAVIASDSAGKWGTTVGSNCSNQRLTSSNGLRLIKHCHQRGLRIANTWKRSRRIHRGTHFLQLNKTWRRLDYIAVPNLLYKMVHVCRAVPGLSHAADRLVHGNFTNHNPVVCTFSVPKKWAWKRFAGRTRKKASPKYDVSGIRLGTDQTAAFSAELECQLSSTSAKKGCVEPQCSRITECLKIAMSKTLTPV